VGGGEGGRGGGKGNQKRAVGCTVGSEGREGRGRTFTFACDTDLIRMFSGFRSQWMTPFAWIKASAVSTCFATRCRRGSVKKGGAPRSAMYVAKSYRFSFKISVTRNRCSEQ